MKNNDKPNKSPYMTCQEVAVYLRKTQGSIRNLVYRKQIAAFKVNRRLLFKKVEIDRWLEKFRVGNEFGY
ncbi:MAG: helix-turn-helix domain-containing protein [Bdellovibrionota bacterium]